MEKAYAAYREGRAPSRPQTVDAHNTAQHKLRATFDSFFTALHAGLKRIDQAVRRHEKTLAEKAQAKGKRTTTDRQTKALKTALEALHAEVKNAESCFAHIAWLQERFPTATYEDVTGLCKLANRAEIEEQDWSLNPGRYVGVVIEEDGKTEEEFIEALLEQQTKLDRLLEDAGELAAVIAKNTKIIAGE